MAFELALRSFWPQNVIRTHVNGKFFTVYEQKVGFDCNPGAHVLAKGPEFSAEYKINEGGLVEFL